MKRTYLTFVLLAALSPAWATINATMQWDVRTTGNDANGGGFDNQVAAPGTDFSLQNAAQTAYTDLVIGATTTQLTSAASPFGATHPGNVIHVTGGTGCTTGWFEVISVSGVTATMDRSVGTAASTCTGNLGGSLLTLAQAKTNAQDGNQIHLKTGTYSTTSAYDFSSGHPEVAIKGYGTTHDDGGSRPTLTTATNSVNLFSVGGNSVLWIDNIIWSSTAGTPGNGMNGGQGYTIVITRCKISGFNVGLSTASTIELTVADSEIASNTGQGINQGLALTIRHSWVHDNGGNGINISNTNADYGVHILFNVISTNGGSTGAGIASTVKKIFHVINNDVYNNAADGLNAPNAFPTSDPFNHPEGIAVMNNIFVDNGQTNGTGYGVNMTAFTYAATWKWGLTGYKNNAYYNNKTGARLGIDADAGAVTMTGVPFTNAAGGDYSLNSTAGAGAACKGAGYPGTFAAGLSTASTPDIGAAQSAAGGGAGGTHGAVYSALWEDGMHRAHFEERYGRYRSVFAYLLLGAIGMAGLALAIRRG